MSFPSLYNESLDNPNTNRNFAMGPAHFNDNAAQIGQSTSSPVVNPLNVPPSFGPGAAGDIAPTNFGALTDAAQGSDHSGLGPLRAGRNPVMRAKLQLNGHDRFQERLGSYFNLVQPYQHHTNVPATGINVYSFALRPEEHQPSGTSI